jgi:transcriptional regulator with XRE-family HTH domain
MNSLAITLGSRIQRLRMRQNRTLQEIADVCGFTRSLLSKIEHGKTTPPIPTLMKIAEALGVDMVDLLSREGEVKPVLTPAAKLADSALTRNEKGYLFHVLAGKRPDKAMQPFLFVARRGEAKPAPLAHRGEEVVYVLEGEMVLRVGSEDYRLGKGDSLYFDAEQPHEVTPVSEKVVYLAVLADPVEAGPATERRRRG